MRGGLITVTFQVEALSRTTLTRHITPTTGDMSFTGITSEFSARAAAKPTHCTTVGTSWIFCIQIDSTGDKRTAVSLICCSTLTQLKCPSTIPYSVSLFFPCESRRAGLNVYISPSQPWLDSLFLSYFVCLISDSGLSVVNQGDQGAYNPAIWNQYRVCLARKLKLYSI